MDLWYNENHTDGVKFSIKIEKHIYSGKSEFQSIDIMDSTEFGRILVLDGYLMLTEKDEFVYHEMITHVPMCVNPDIKTVLVVGAGDGGTVNRLVQYPGIEKIDMVEIDEMVVQKCREFFPDLTKGLDDERVTVFFEDGLRFVRKHKKKYDLIIVDSTDPFGPGEGLFSKEFYGNCFNALTDEGILVNQHESPFYDQYKTMINRTHKKIKGFFPFAKVYQAHIPTYPSGHWLFGFACKKQMTIEDINAKQWEKLGIRTKYYNPRVHIGSFCLPNYVRELFLNED